MGETPVTEPALSVELRRVQLDLVRPHHAAHGDTKMREVIIVKVSDAVGNVGWGECAALASPSYTAEYLDGCWHLLTSELLPQLLAAPAEGLGQAVQRVVGHPMARAAVMTALLDLDLRAQERTLARALSDGANVRETVQCTAVISMHPDVDEVVKNVADAVAGGYSSVKLKIAPGRDAGPIEAVRSTWPDIRLALDANGSYGDANFAEERLVGDLDVAAVGIDYIEQPLPADDLVGAAVLARRLGVPIALDESIMSIGDACTALALGAMGVVNIKPARVGGPLIAMAIAQVAAEQGCDVFCGGMLETGVGRAAALAFAAQEVCTLPTDLGPSARYFDRDITPSIMLRHGEVVVPQGLGIGLEPDPTALAAATVQRWERHA